MPIGFSSNHHFPIRRLGTCVRIYSVFRDDEPRTRTVAKIRESGARLEQEESDPNHVGWSCWGCIFLSTPHLITISLFAVLLMSQGVSHALKLAHTDIFLDRLVSTDIIPISLINPFY